MKNKPKSEAQARKNMIVYLKNQSNYKMKDFDGMSYEEIRPIFEKVWDFNHNFVPMDLGIEKEKKKPAEFQVEQIEKDTTGKRKKSLPRKGTRSTTKRQKVELDDEKEDLKGYLDIVPREEIAVDVDSLSTKYPIVDWKTYTLSENFMYYKIIRGDGSSKNYKILSEMLYDFDRQDIVELYRLVKERYSSSKPEGYDLMLWGDLHTLFEPDEESEIWMNQNEYNLISWSLCDFCGVHILLMQNGIAIHMLTEKKYPLSQEMISKMLSKRLEVDQESTQAYELLKFIRSQVKKNPNLNFFSINGESNYGFLRKKQNMVAYLTEVIRNTLENGDMEITATIDGKVKVVSEASIRRHLKLEDSDEFTHWKVMRAVWTLNELMVLYTTLSKKVVETLVSDLSRPNWTYGAVTLCLIMKVKEQDEDELEDPSKQRRKIAQIDEDEGITLVSDEYTNLKGRNKHDFEFIAHEEDYIDEPDISTANVPVRYYCAKLVVT
ncbi:hypothetical protein Tco_0799678 [Tanacetum coccineum]|uniref:Uncharacterized protein n=1 Tax=Tanacetum coccineum TaxID=301880 RepID=A0ABQ4ZUP8_9ASTR